MHYLVITKLSFRRRCICPVFTRHISCFISLISNDSPDSHKTVLTDAKTHLLSVAMILTVDVQIDLIFFNCTMYMKQIKIQYG